MCVSGVLLTFEEAIVNWADKFALKKPAAERQSVSLDIVAATAMRTRAGAVPSSIALYSAPGSPIAFSFQNDTRFFSYSGEDLGEGAAGLREGFRTIREWHRWLGRPDSSRAIGKAITGAANLVFVFLLGSGLYLWMPRKWAWTSVRGGLLLNASARGKARDWNWHNVFGIWSLPPLLVIAGTGVIISYGWANHLLYRITASDPPAPRTAGPRSAPKRAAGSESAALKNLDLAFSEVKQKFPNWGTIRARFSPDAKTGMFTIDEADALPQYRAQMTVALQTGEAVRVEGYSSLSTGRRWRVWARFLHTGEAAGVAGRLIAGLASVGGAVLAWTGLALAWRRFFARKSFAVSQ
jgi:uncharacterized iron-regulated membrane protein